MCRATKLNRYEATNSAIWDNCINHPNLLRTLSNNDILLKYLFKFWQANFIVLTYLLVDNGKQIKN